MNQVCSGPSRTNSEKPTKADGPICWIQIVNSIKMTVARITCSSRRTGKVSRLSIK